MRLAALTGFYIVLCHCKTEKPVVKARFRKRWNAIGPFIRGNFEHDGDPLEFYGGIKKLKIGDKNAKFLSEVATGSYIGWQKVEMNSQGQVGIPFGNYDSRFLQEGFKHESVLNTQAWAVGTLQTNVDAMYLIDCPGLHTLEVGGNLLRGNIHGSAFPVYLTGGNHTVYIKVSGEGRRGGLSFMCSVKASKKILTMQAPEAGPHIHDGTILGTPVLALNVMNAGQEWIHSSDLKFHIESLDVHKSLNAQVEVPRHQPHLPSILAPGLWVQMPLVLNISSSTRAGKAFPDAKCVHFKLQMTHTSGQLDSAQVALQCRQKHQSFLFTFVDADGSAGHAAAIKPRCSKKKCPKAPLPVVLTLSGVSVGPLSQADSYKVGDGSGDFIFGFEEAWVLAPERSGPHNWEDWGFRTVLRSLEALSESTANTAMAADSSRIFLSGHSRGGHGAWNVAERIPDKLMAVAPMGGWTYRQYGDVSWNTLFMHDLQLAYMDPMLKSILERCLIEGDTSVGASNLNGIPVVARQGSADRTVMPFLNRRMARIAFENGADVSISEVPNQGHWWWDTKEPNDGGVMNDKEMRTFSSKHLKAGIPALPASFRVTVINPSSFWGRGGLRILQTEVPFRRSFIDVQRQDVDHWKLRTINIRRFQFAPSNRVPKLTIDGTVLSKDVWSEAGAQLCRLDAISRQWAVCSDAEDYERRERGPSTWGPARQVVMSKFAIVAYVDSDGHGFYGAVWNAARYISHGHWMAVGSRAPVLRPEDVTDDIRQNHNLILIGGPTALQGALTADARARWPVSINNASLSTDDEGTCSASAADSCEETVVFTIGPCSFRGAAHGLLFTVPRWEDRAKPGKQAFIDLIVTGSDAQGLLDLTTFHHATLSRSPFANMAPDFMLSGPEYKAKGFGGLLAAGFWGSNWEWRPDSAYMEC